MPLSFSSATGNLMNRLGKLGLLLKQLRSYQTAQLANMTNTTNGVVAQYDGESDIQAIMGSSYIGLLGGSEGMGSIAQSMAEATVNRMVFRDNPRISQTLQSLNTVSSINEIIRQMKVQGASVLAMTITATPTIFTGTGNGVLVASVKRPFDGKVLENSFAETMLVTCTNDSYVGGATAGNESFLATGVGQQSNLFAFDWPLGSNAQQELSAIDGSVNNGSGNLLTNSGFENWTNNVPDNWTLNTGTAGTNIIKETSIVYDGGNSVNLVGDGSTLTQISQQLDNSAGTSGSLDPLIQSGFNIWLRRDGTAAGAGVLTIDLADAVLGNVVKDANGVDNSFTIDLTALTTIFTAYNVAFRTPLIMPTNLYLRIRMTTALTSGRSVYLDRGSLGLMTQIYTGGPYLSLHSGSIPFTFDDYAQVAVTNSRGAGGTLDTFQTLLARILPVVYQNEILFPSSSVPTISDSALIS